MTSLACAAKRRPRSSTGNRCDASLESEGLPERSGWSSPGCRDRQGAASEHLIPCLTILTTLVTLTAMILSTILGMIHRHDRRNHSCTMLGMITRTIFWTFRTITTTTHRHYPGDDPRQPPEMIPPP